MAYPNIEPLQPEPGQESVWAYPRPPRLEREPRRIRIVFDGVTIADSHAAWRVLETSHPPTYYLPPTDLAPGILTPAGGSSVCEWKGPALYYTLRVNARSAERVAWSYPTPWPGFEPIAGFLAFYCAPMDECWVGDMRATPQPGGFYGGWVTAHVVGPFKGAPGTMGW
jgi:uncharacterized protein (DUF427 family)